MFLLGLRDVLAVGSAFGFASERVVMRREHLFNEVVDLRFHLWDTSSVGKVAQQTNVPTPIRDFCFPVQLPPQAFCSGRNGCSTNGYLFLFVIMILLRVNDI